VGRQLTRTTWIGYDFFLSLWLHWCTLSAPHRFIRFSFGCAHTGDLNNRKRPTQVNLSDVKSIAAGPNHTIAVTYAKLFPLNVVVWVTCMIRTLSFQPNRRVYIWGKNDSGALGVPESQKGVTTTPSCVESLNDKVIREVACGVNITLALCSNGDIYSWGEKSSNTLLLFCATKDSQGRLSIY